MEQVQTSLHNHSKQVNEEYEKLTGDDERAEYEAKNAEVSIKWIEHRAAVSVWIEQEQERASLSRKRAGRR